MPKTGKPDPVLIAVLINREHSRLSSQVKTLETLNKKDTHFNCLNKQHSLNSCP